MQNKIFIFVLLQAFSLHSIISQTSVDTLVEIENVYEKVFKIGDTLYFKENRFTLDDVLQGGDNFTYPFYWIKIIPYDKKGTMTVFKLDGTVLIWEKTYYGTGKVTCHEGNFYDPERMLEVKAQTCIYERFPHGIWRYFNKQNQIETVEIYDMGELKSRVHLLDHQK
jgi:hypothetical protein